MDHDIRYLLDRGDDGDDEEALRTIDEALRLAPGNAELLVLRCEALRNLELYEEAIQAARAACRAHESSAHTHAALGEALLEWSDEADDPTATLEEALEALERAVARSEEPIPADYWLAECLARLGRPGEAIVRLAGVARARGWDAACLARLERLLAEGERPVPHAERPAMHWHPDENLLLAIALRRAGDLDGARAELRSERALDPLSREPEHQLALLADPEVALALLKWPCSASGFHEAWTLRGELLATLDHPTEARSAHERALREGRRWVDPSGLEALELRALGTDVARRAPQTLQQEILEAMLRERRLAQAHADASEHCDAMARASAERWDELDRSGEAAWRIARTARAHCAPELSSEGWYAAVRQGGDPWESLTAAEQQAVSGLIVVSTWFANATDPQAWDASVIASAAFELIRRATDEARASGRATERFERTLAGLAEVAASAGVPMGLETAASFVEAAIGRPGETGLLHELAELRPKPVI